MDPILALSAAKMLFDFAMKERAILMQKEEWTPEQEASWKARYAELAASPAWQTAAQEGMAGALKGTATGKKGGGR